MNARALALYRSILRTAKSWKGGKEEQEYIRNEARTQFRQNRNLKDKAAVEAKIKEGQDRLDLGIHYQIPYPRMHHATQFKKREYQSIPIIK